MWTATLVIMLMLRMLQVLRPGQPRPVTPALLNWRTSKPHTFCGGLFSVNLGASFLSTCWESTMPNSAGCTSCWKGVHGMEALGWPGASSFDCQPSGCPQGAGCMVVAVSSCTPLSCWRAWCCRLRSPFAWFCVRLIMLCSSLLTRMTLQYQLSFAWQCTFQAGGNLAHPLPCNVHWAVLCWWPFYSKPCFLRCTVPGRARQYPATPVLNVSVKK